MSRSIKVDQVAEAFNTVPGDLILVTDGQPASDINLTTSWTQTMPETGSGILFTTKTSGKYRIHYRAIYSCGSIGSYHSKLVFDEGEAYEQTVGGDTDAGWRRRVNNSQFSYLGAIDEVELTAGDHRVKGYAREDSSYGGSIYIGGVSNRPNGGPVLHLELLSGSGAGGILVDTEVLAGDETLNNGTFTDVTGLSITVNCFADEVIDLQFQGVGEYAAAGSIFMRWEIDGATYLPDATNGIAGRVGNASELYNLSNSTKTAQLSAGSHTIKVQAKGNVASQKILAGARMSVTRYRGGQVPIEQAGTEQTTTPRAQNYSGQLVQVDSTSKANIGGQVVETKTQADTPLSLDSVIDNGKLYVNTGASGQLDITLPAAAEGLQYTFCVGAAQTLKIITASTADDIRIAASLTAGASRYIEASTVGNMVTLVAVSDALWLAVAHEGTWTFST